MAKSAADGQSLILVPSTHGTARALYASLPYEESDLVAIGLIASTPYVFVVHPDFPAKSFGVLGVVYLEDRDRFPPPAPAPPSTSAASW